MTLALCWFYMQISKVRLLFYGSQGGAGKPAILPSRVSHCTTCALADLGFRVLGLGFRVYRVY